MRPRRTMHQINVVPYIDVMLVLLVIFMVTAPMIQLGTVDLPSVGKATEVPAKPLQIIVRADRSLRVRDQSRSDEERPISRSQLADVVREAQRRNPDQPVLIAGDKDVRYEAVLAVMDELQRQQVKRVGLLVQPSGQPLAIGR